MTWEEIVVWKLLILVGTVAKAIWWTLVDMILYLRPVEIKPVRGKVVLITGASRGLGRQLALQFAQLGAKVVLWNLIKEDLETVSEEISAMGGFYLAYECDVSDEEQIQKTAKLVLQDVGQVDILINNAGIATKAPVVDMKVEAIRKIFEINIMSHYWTIKQFLPEMINRREGHIVAIGSLLSFVTLPEGSAYCGTKHAVAALMDCLEQETSSDSNINFTTIYPGFFTSGLVTDVISRYPFLLPVPDAEEVARTAIRAIRTNQRKAVFPRRFGLLLPFVLLTLSKRAQVLVLEHLNFTYKLTYS